MRTISRNIACWHIVQSSIPSLQFMSVLFLMSFVVSISVFVREVENPEGFSFVCVWGYVACRLPEISTLLTYLILDRKGLVSGSDFPYLNVCRRSVAPCSGPDDVEVEALVLRLVADYVVKVPPCFTSTFCSVLAPWQSAQPSCVWWCRR